MTATVPYASAAAFVAAINARLKAATQRTGTDHASLRRQFAYSRALARVFISDPHGWVLKGGVALLARVTTARHSLDIDLLRTQNDPDAAVEALHAALSTDIGDYFRFDISRPVAVATENNPAVDGRRVTIRSYCGVPEFAAFTVDLVVAGNMTQRPEPHRPVPLIDIDGLANPPYQLYPIADHIADKVAATLTTYGPSARPSSRVRDLVDLVVIARTQPLDAAELLYAIDAELHDRGLDDIDSFVVPSTWRQMYPRAASRTPNIAPYDNFDKALELATSLLNPILSNEIPNGTWHPTRLRWSVSSSR